MYLLQVSFLRHKIDILMKQYRIYLENIEHHDCEISEKKYYQLFIYNLVYISSMLEKDYDKASESKYLFHKINVDMNTTNLNDYIQDMFPIYSRHLLKELLEEESFTNYYEKEDLEFIIKNDIFVDSEELVDKLTDEYLKEEEYNKNEHTINEIHEEDVLKVVEEIKNNSINFKLAYKASFVLSLDNKALFFHKIHKNEIEFAGQVYTLNGEFVKNIPFPTKIDYEFTSNDMSIFHGSFSQKDKDVVKIIFQGNNIRHGYYTIETRYNLKEERYIDIKEIKIH